MYSYLDIDVDLNSDDEIDVDETFYVNTVEYVENIRVCISHNKANNTWSGNKLIDQQPRLVSDRYFIWHVLYKKNNNTCRKVLDLIDNSVVETMWLDVAYNAVSDQQNCIDDMYLNFDTVEKLLICSDIIFDVYQG